MQTTEHALSPEIKLLHVAAKPCVVISGKMKMADLPKFLGEAYGKLYPYVMSQSHAEECFARYPSWEGEEFEVEAGVVSKEPLPDKDPIRHSRLGGHQALYALHIGPYEKVGSVYEAIQAKMKELDLKPAGAPYEIYLNDPAHVLPEELKTEIYWPAEAT